MGFESDDELCDYSDSYNDHEAISEVLAALKPLKVNEMEVELELDKVDWDIDVAIANLRKRHAAPKRTPAQKPTQKPTQTSTQKTAQTSAQQPTQQPKDQPTKGKLTPLQMLALRRKQSAGNSQPEADAQKQPSNGSPSLDRQESESHSIPEGTQSTHKSLAQLAAERRGRNDTGAKLSALDRLRQRTSQPKEVNKPQSTSLTGDNTSSPRIPQSQHSISNSEEKPTWKPKWEPEISFSLPKSSDLGKPSVFGAMISVSPAKHNICKNMNTNFLATAENAASEFSKPSPDDHILSVQSAAFAPGNNNGKTTKVLNSGGKKSGQSKVAVSDSSKNVKSAAEGSTNDAAEAAPAGGAVASSGISSKVSAAMQASSSSKSSPTGLLSRLSAMKLKSSCSFVVIGHVDAGKSTLMGRLLLDTGALNPKLVQKHEHESAKMGKQSFWLAWALDATSEERERGVTVDIGEAAFATDKTNFTVLDCPGHKDYVPNMIAGVTQADLAVLVVDSDTNAFESGFSLDGQTKEHAVLTRSLGISKIVVAVNKMDTQGWDEHRFTQICSELTEFLAKKVGFQPNQIVYVPTSGIDGVNVVKKSEDPKWYKGPSLVEALDEFAQSHPDQTNAVSQPLRFSISNVYSEPFQSTITVSGRVLTGSVEPNDVIEVVNSHEAVRVKTITDKEFLVSGDQGEMKLTPETNATDVSVQSIRPGDIICGYGANLSVTQEFVAKVRLFDLPRPVLPGTPLAFHLGRVEDTVKVVSILGSLDPKAASKKLRHLGKGSAARVLFRLSKPVVLTTPDCCKELGRFVLRLNGSTIGGGVVEEVH